MKLYKYKKNNIKTQGFQRIILFIANIKNFGF